jgi:hypothetical protein
MKKTALLAAATALIAASPAAAANGYVGVEYDTGETAVLFSEFDSEGWQGEAAVGFGGAGWGAQLGGSFGNFESDDLGLDWDTRHLAAHLWWSGSGWRIGGVVANSNLEGVSTLDVDETVYGLEGTFDVGASAVLFSSLTTGSGDWLGVDYDSFNWDAGVNFYASPNIRIGGFFGIGSFDLDGVGDFDTSSLGVNGEFQPWSAPVSITVGWNSYTVDDLDIDASMFRVGARWNFGGGTLRDRDNSTPFDTTTGFAARAGTW